MYELEDHEGELSVVNKKDDTYRVEKIFRKKNGMALVKWLGYDSRSKTGNSSKLRDTYLRRIMRTRYTGNLEYGVLPVRFNRSLKTRRI